MKKLLLAVIALGFSVGVNAACDTKSLKGRYYYGVAGIDNGYGCGNIGVIDFDGKGTATAQAFYGCGGETNTALVTGTYQLTSGCVGQIVNEANGFHYYFVMNKALTTANIMVSQGGVLGTGTFTKQ